MQVVSSMTMTAAEPTDEPAARSESKSMFAAMMIGPGTTFTEEPPGITAFSAAPAAHSTGYLEQVRKRNT